jgi:hypothetical protein
VLVLPARCFHPEQIWAGGGPQECGPFAVERLAYGSPLPDDLGLNGAAAFGAVKQENGEQSQELSAGSILYCRLLELCSVVARRAHCDATLGSFS